MPEAFSVMTTWESLGALVYRGDLHSWFLQGLAVGRVRPYRCGCGRIQGGPL
jgi:hypothetical protein